MDLEIELPQLRSLVREHLQAGGRYDAFLTVPGHPEVFAAGDAAAVPDLTRPGEITGMTAQHAARQGRRAARNLAASLGHGRRHPYRHHDLGFAVDLAGARATADPVGIPISGVAAKALTRGYHHSAIPANRARIAADWMRDAVLPRRVARQSSGATGCPQWTAA